MLTYEHDIVYKFAFSQFGNSVNWCVLFTNDDN